MSHTTHSHAPRILAVAGLLGFASLVAPAATQAQSISPERALLNTIPVISYSAITIAADRSRAVDSEWALLGRSTAAVRSQSTALIGSLEKVRPVDGERALLGKITPSETRWPALAL